MNAVTPPELLAPDLLERALAASDLRGVFDLLAHRHGAVESVAAPGRVALRFEAMPAALAAIKSALNARGIGRGDVVVLAMPNGPEAALCCVAVIASAIAAPLNATYTEDEYRRYLGRLRPRAVIALRDHATAIRAAAGACGIPVLDLVPDLAAPAGTFALEGGEARPCRDPQWNGPDDVATVFHTSGTTAQQKLVPLRLRHLMAPARDMRRTFALGPGDVSLHVMPLYHGHGARAALLQPLLAGSTVVCLPRFSADDFLTQLRMHGATWYSASYTIHKAVLDLLHDRPDAARGLRLRFIRSGSGRLDPAVMAGLEAALGTVVIERYGQSETGTVAINPLPPGRRKPGSVGLPEGTEIVIRSPSDGTHLPVGMEGEVIVRGPGVFDGYLDDPAATAAAFVDGWFRTGDLGRFDAEGYLTITGRIKEMINRGGEKVSPMEVEAVLARHPAIRAVCVFGIPHPRLGEDIAAAAVAADGATVAEDDILAFASGALADFKLPRRVYFVPALALGPTHKVDRRAMALQCLAADPALADEPGEATDDLHGEILHGEIRARLEPLWSVVLRLDAIPPHRDFFLLGGDSLSAAQLCHRVARAFGVELPLRAVFREARSLARMAATIAAAATPRPTADRGVAPIAPRKAGARIPLSFAQEQIWVHDQLQVGSTAYSNNRVARLRGTLDVDALASALSMLVARHEVLRTTIEVSGGAPHQVIHPPAAVTLAVADLAMRDAADRESEVARVVAAAIELPFDLAAGPLLRAALCRLGPDDHVFVLSIHHILIEGGAMRVLMRELAGAYRHLVAGAPPLPPVPTLQFGDFAVWDRSRDAAAALGRHLDYWRGALAELREVELPSDRPRPRVMTAVGALLVRPLSRIDLPRLRHLARSECSSLFSLLIAAVAVFLHRMSGAPDVVLGAPFSRRSRPGMEGVVGLLLNMLPVRVRVAADPSVRKLLHEVTDRVLGAIEHQDAPLTRILDAAGIRRSPDRHPLFQTVVALASRESRSVDLPGINSELIAADDGSTKYDLQFFFLEDGDRLELMLRYDGVLFDAATAGRFAETVERVLETVAAAPEAPISTLEIMPETHRRLLLDAWSGIGATPPVSGTIAEIFAAHARSRPDATALVCGDRRITYAALDSWSTRLAHRLRAAGVRQETVVGLAAGRTPGLIAAQLAILKAGGAFLPLDPRLPVARLSFMVEDSRALLVLAEDAAVTAMAGVAAPVLPLDATGDDLIDEPAAPIASFSGPRSLAYVMYTSGSTGMPKGVAVEQRGVIRLVRDTGYARFGPDERFLQQGSVAFDVSMFEIWGALLNGGCVVQVPTETPTLQEIARVIVAERVTTCWFTSGLFSQMVDTVLECFAAVDQVVTGGEVVSVSHARAFRAAHPRIRLINGYGPTEVTGFATAYTVADDADLNPSVPIGGPIANTQVYVLDPQQRLLPIGAVGELCLGGAGVARGYLNHPELTAQRFVASAFVAGERLYRTGDLVRWRSNGTLQFLGRSDRQLKLRGFRIEPVEIETALQAHEAIDQAVVVLRNDAHGEARLVAFCACDGRAIAPEETELRASLRDRLPAYMVPAVFVFLPSLPLTPQGKVDLKALPEVDADRTGVTSRVAPSTPFEEELVAIWREVLRVEHVGVTDDFFALGGHSLLAVKMLFRMWNFFGVELPLASVFHHPTIEQLALLVLERLVSAEGIVAPAP